MNAALQLLPIWQIIGPLAVEVALAVLLISALARSVKSALWRRALWQVCLAGLPVLLALESTGVVRPMLGHFWFKLAHNVTEESASALAVTTQSKNPLTPALSPSDGAREKIGRRDVSPPSGDGSTDEQRGSSLPIGWGEGQGEGIVPQNSQFGPPIEQRTEAASESVAVPGPNAPSGQTIVVLILFWATGSALYLVWLAISQTALMMIYRKRPPLANVALTETVGELSRQFGIRRRVQVIECARLKTPIVFGIVRPTVGLPRDFISAFDVRQQESMLAHELAHLALRDPAWQVLGKIVTALLWWHPFVWWARRQWHLASECAADEACVHVVGGPDALAECLLRYGERLTATPALGRLGIAGDGFRSSLGQRVARLLEMRTTPSDTPTRAPRWFWQLFGTALLSAAIIGSATWATPKIFATEEFNQGDTVMNTIHQSWQRSLFAVTLAAALGGKPVPALSDDAAKAETTPETPATNEPAALQAPQALPNSAFDRRYQRNRGMSGEMMRRYGLSPEMASRYGLWPAQGPAQAGKTATDSPIQPAQSDDAEEEEGGANPKPVAAIDPVLAARYGLRHPSASVRTSEAEDALIEQFELSPKYQGILTELAKLQESFGELSLRYKADHPRMNALKQRMAELSDMKDKLEEANANIRSITVAQATTPVTPEAPAEPAENPEEQIESAPRNSFRMDPMLMQRYGLLRPGMQMPTNAMMTPGGVTRAAKGRQAVRAKLEEIVIEEVIYDAIPLSEVVKDLKETARRRDPKKRGINFLINPSSRVASAGGVDPTTGAPLPSAQPIDIGPAIIRINLALKDVRLIDVLDVIKTVSDVPIRYSIEEYGVVFSAAPAQPLSPMVSRTFKIDAATLTQGLENVAGLATTGGGSRGLTQSQRLTELLRQFLASAGVTIDSPNQVFYNDRTGILMIRMSDQDQEIVQAAIEMLGGQGEAGREGANSTSPQARARNLAANRDQINADAKFLIETGQLDQAEQKLKELLRFEPNDQTAQESLRRLQELQGRQEGRFREKRNGSGAVESDTDEAGGRSNAGRDAIPKIFWMSISPACAIT